MGYCYVCIVVLYGVYYVCFVVGKLCCLMLCDLVVVEIGEGVVVLFDFECCVVFVGGLVVIGQYGYVFLVIVQYIGMYWDGYDLVYVVYF